MRVLVATKETQGHRATDFCLSEEGELVCFPLECEEESIDAECGCKRSLYGVKTGKATTTFRVAEREALSLPKLTGVLTSLLVVTRYRLTKELARAEAEQTASSLAALASGFPEGTVLERRGDEFVVRSRRSA